MIFVAVVELRIHRDARRTGIVCIVMDAKT